MLLEEGAPSLVAANTHDLHGQRHGRVGLLSLVLLKACS